MELQRLISGGRRVVTSLRYGAIAVRGNSIRRSLRSLYYVIIVCCLERTKRDVDNNNTTAPNHHHLHEYVIANIYSSASVYQIHRVTFIDG